MSVGTPTYMFKVDRPTTYEAPSFEPLSRKLLFDSNGQYCLENMIKHFLKEGVLDPKDAEQIFITAAEIFRKEPNVIRIQDPITVVGDIHGQFHDMPALFQVGGDINSQPYLFLGDYVDRGCFSSEVILFLLAAKIRYPERITMLRGNHECRHLTNYFNTKKEFLFKYTPEVYEAMIEVFDTLPLVAILNKKFFCVHGGLSPDLNTIADIEKINRFRNPPKRGAMADLLWSDPMSDEAEAKNSSSGNSVLFAPNEERGCSYTYSFKATCNFLSANRLLCVIRAHEAQEEGYKLYKKTSAGFPSAICIFSAPNYCDSYNNKAAIVKFSNNSMNVKQFHSLEHPYYLPNFMNAFTWSLPYVGERVTEMIAAILQMGDSDLDEEDGGSSVSVPTPEQIALRNKLRAKVKAIAHMSRRFRSLREEYESLTALNGLIAGDLPQELIAKGPDALRNQYCSGNFFAVKEIDQRNEKLPPGFSDELL